MMENETETKYWKMNECHSRFESYQGQLIETNWSIRDISKAFNDQVTIEIEWYFSGC